MSLRSFLGSRAGKNFYNICYCWGACLVILGAVLTIMHAQHANLFLMIGLCTEVFIFFISGFDEPSREYKWERVYPILNDKSANTDPKKAKYNVKTVVSGNADYQKALEKLNRNVETLNELYINKLNEMYEAQIKQLKNGNSNVDVQESTRKLADEVAALNEKYRKMLDTMN